MKTMWREKKGRSLGWVADWISKVRILGRICYKLAVIMKVNFDIIRDVSREEDPNQNGR
jgi:hypothetical protein